MGDESSEAHTDDRFGIYLISDAYPRLHVVGGVDVITRDVGIEQPVVLGGESSGHTVLSGR